MRLFLAIEPDAHARELLARDTAQVRSSLGTDADRWRWVAADLVHVTMHFLGEFDDAAEARVCAAVGYSIARPQFDVTVSTVGTFPPHRPPQTLWFGVTRGADALTEVHADLEQRLHEAGVALESRPFTPHLTIARARRGRRAHAPAMTSIDPIAWHVDRVTLYASDLSGPAPRYTARHVVRLADAP